jgi:hypothetical protein
LKFNGEGILGIDNMNYGCYCLWGWLMDGEWGDVGGLRLGFWGNLILISEIIN